MPEMLMQLPNSMLAAGLVGLLVAIKPYLLILLGFSAVIFVHELGHFLVAKLGGVRVEKFCIGFGRELFGFTRGETRYGFNILPLGGYVKMMGQETWQITGEESERLRGTEISEDDIRMVMDQTGATKEAAEAALKEANGDLAVAIMKLKE